MLFNERLTMLRTEVSLTQAQVAQEIGISRATYSHYETGRSQPDIQTIKRLTEFFNVSIEYLLGFTDKQQNQISSTMIKNEVFESPVLGTNEFGEMLFTNSFYTCSADALPQNNSYFYLQAKEDNMFPLIQTGDLVLIKKESCIENGDIAAVMFKESSETRLFKVYKYGIQLILLSTNSMHEPLITKQDLVNILGIALFRLGPVNSQPVINNDSSLRKG